VTSETLSVYKPLMCQQVLHCFHHALSLITAFSSIQRVERCETGRRKACEYLLSRGPHRRCLVPPQIRQPALTWRAAASAVSSGRVLKAIAAFGAALWMMFTTVSNSAKLFGGILSPPPITTQS
jgi:hypothetical protein